MFDDFDSGFKADNPANLTALLLSLLKCNVLAFIGERNKNGDLSENDMTLVINPYLTRIFNVHMNERGNVELQFRRENDFEKTLLPVLVQWDKLRRSGDIDAMETLEDDLLTALE